MKPARRWAASLTGLTIALVIPAVLTSAGSFATADYDGDAIDAVLLNEIVVWILAFAIMLLVRFWEKRPLSSIGFVRPVWPGVRFGLLVVFGLLALAASAAAGIQALGVPVPTEPNEFILALPLWLQLCVSISAGFTEETLFRGYAIERATELTGSRWLGAIVPIVVFGAIHAPFWGWAHAFVAGLTGVWLTLIYLWRRNLWTNITAHALMNSIVFIAIYALGDAAK